ncbi:hypothetical protein [Bacillus sp. SRB3LM]|uniref:hypothetical protein n=1 Tax=Bacillus sp. SRB3LM TaxID=2608689 RepID=UPI0018C40064|nr:hypothetical protein [Bacillus sp. SRB3LM]
MNYILFRTADGNTGYMSQHGNGGGHHREPGGIQGVSVKRMYFHHKLRYTVK